MSVSKRGTTLGPRRIGRIMDKNTKIEIRRCLV